MSIQTSRLKRKHLHKETLHSYWFENGRPRAAKASGTVFLAALYRFIFHIQGNAAVLDFNNAVCLLGNAPVVGDD